MPRRATNRNPAAQPQEVEAPATPAWIEAAVSTNAPFEERVGLLRDNLLRGEGVLPHHVLRLFPRHVSELLSIGPTVAADTAWLMASLRYYKDPWGAFKKMSECAARGLECAASSGREFYATHQRWVADRGELGLLSAASMGLFFRERRDPVEPSRHKNRA